MAEKDTSGSRLEKIFDEVTRHADTAVEHTLIGMVVGAGLIAKETISTGKKTLEVSGRVGKNVAIVVYEKASQCLR